MPFLAKAQTDLLILEKGGSEVKTYTTGLELNMQTIYDQWIEGTITDMRHDSVFLNGMPFHYKEIMAVRIGHVNFWQYRVACGHDGGGSRHFCIEGGQRVISRGSIQVLVHGFGTGHGGGLIGDRVFAYPNP